MAGKIKVECDFCGKEFEKYASKVSKHNFCCREHYLKYHSKDVPLCTCQVCGKQFKGDKYNANKHCSRECYNKAHEIKNKKRICLSCGKEFIEDKYCSWECYNKDRHMPKGENHWNWQGGKSKENDRHDSVEYKTWRQHVYQKDGFKCVICGSKNKLNAHHIYSWKYYPELRYDINNGATLCESCHIKIHKKYGYDSDKKMFGEEDK